MKKVKILWTDDEIDLLKPHIIFLESKGYEVHTSTNGYDTIEMVSQQSFDILFLDENMPGLTGLETLAKIKEVAPHVPVVMITKSEEENIMDEAIGSKMADYLIKPVNPKQVLLSIKKNVDQKRLVTEQTTSAYQSQFGKIGMQINDSFTIEDWKEVYRKLVFWELELSNSEDNTMNDVLQMQKNDANNAFARFVKKNYSEWFKPENSEERPLLSPDLFKKRILPQLDKQKKVFVLVIDNLRYDQWRDLVPMISEEYNIASEELYYSILPTATMYARNAFFAGLMPSEIAKHYPEHWVDEDEEGGKNLKEKELLEEQLKRLGRSESMFFDKVSSLRTDKKVKDTVTAIQKHDLSVMVFNFVDMISHSRTEIEVVRELAKDEKAYRSLTRSWFQHSNLYELLKQLAELNITVMLTTDHGSIRVQNAVKVIGDRNTNTNLRYKVGKNLNYNKKQVFDITKPASIHLPAPNVSSSFIFATESDFIAYPNNYNHYVNYYKDTFQHGGISMEEMIIPLITLKAR
ncbi:PglZ domain-containing protein [Prolixibacteraceae bacterium JC049]|nr:PglZ domain-containing protein [Prolixibacteraceae bacterium JC049]